MLSNIVDKPIVDIIIPTYENNRLLLGCVQSLMNNTQPRPFRVLIANNGLPGVISSLSSSDKNIEVHEMGSNLGWEGGINTMLTHVEAPLTMLLNDDIHFVGNDPAWLLKMIAEFKDPQVGAVGPSSNYVMQRQNIFMQGLPFKMNVHVLIGMCMLVRTEILKKLGGLGKNLPGGDDLDLSMKIESMGYKLRCMRNVFVYHHGAQTGRRVHGAYWDSEEHQDLTNIELIRRNGFNKFMQCRFGQHEDVTTEPYNGLKEDAEGHMVRSFAQGPIIVEMGCGGNKTVPDAIGVDIFPKGVAIPSLSYAGSKQISQADVVCRVDETSFDTGYADCIIARHILEHMVNPVKTLREWHRILKPGGRLIIAVPDQDISNTIPLSPEHVHAYNKESLTDLILAVLPNMTKVNVQYANNGMSFVGVYDKN